MASMDVLAAGWAALCGVDELILCLFKVLKIICECVYLLKVLLLLCLELIEKVCEFF